MRQIKARIEIEPKEKGDIEIIYIPDTTQILEAGKRYLIILDLPREKAKFKTAFGPEDD